MTISSTNRKAGPFIGNGSASVFAFSFRVFAASDLEVVRITVATGVETTLTINSAYTVSLNADQNSNPGGSITLTGGALASGYNLIITSNIANLQPTDLTNQGGFYPEVITGALDRATIQIQQLDEHVNRTLAYPITDPSLGVELPAVAQRKGTVLAFNATTGAPEAGPTIAAIGSVSANVSDINTVAANIADVNTVADDVTNVNTVATNIANVNTTAGNIANVNTVSSNIAAVNTVVANIVPIQNASGNAAAAAASASSAQTSATSAAASASTAVTAKNAAVTAAEASGSIYGYYDTKALANAALSGAPANAVIAVFADETRNGLSTRYRKESSAWVFKEYFAPRTIIDVVGRPQVDPNMDGIRSAGLKLRKAIADVRGGTRQSFRVLAIGDSLSTYNWTTAHMQMQRVLEGYLRSTPVYAYGSLLSYGTPSNYGAVTMDWNGTYSTSVARDKYDYTKSWTGSFIEHGAGQVSVFSVGNVDIIADRLLIPIITEPGAGSIKIEIAQETNPPVVASASWRNPTAGEIVSAHSLTAGELIVSANGSLGLDMVILSVALNFWSVKITQVSGATVRTLPNVMNEVRNAAAVNTYRLATASNGFGSETSTAQPVMAGMIAAYDPDVIVISSDDSRAAYENFLPKLESALTASGLSFKPLVLLECNPFYSNGPGLDDATIADRTAYCHQFAASRVGWDVIDGLALSGGLSEAQRAGWGNDGIHYNGELAWQMTRNWAISRGYMPLATDRAGGDASFADITKSSSRKLLTSAIVHAMLGMPSMQDTGSATWSSMLAGTGAYSRAASGFLQLSSGATASSTVVAYINDGLPLWGSDQGQRSADLPGGFSCQARLTVRTTNGVARIMWAGDRIYNGVYKGDLTASGVGFVIRDNIVKGMCWDGAAVVESSSSFAANAGGSGTSFDLQLILTPGVLPNGTGSSSYGTCEWFVNGVSLGKGQYFQVVNIQSLRAELTNGADAANYVVQVSPPKVVTVR